ncbi:MAG: hypothetical protein ACRCVA_24005 [Phreatobacter sp.]
MKDMIDPPVFTRAGASHLAVDGGLLSRAAGAFQDEQLFFDRKSGGSNISRRNGSIERTITTRLSLG